MKFLPLKYRETQTDWFGKRGISWHISVVVRRETGGNLQHQAFVHIAKNCSQDSNVVAAIMEHILRNLSNEHLEITTAYFRQDNAGCYKSAAMLEPCPLMQKTTGDHGVKKVHVTAKLPLLKPTFVVSLTKDTMFLRLMTLEMPSYLTMECVVCELRWWIVNSLRQHSLWSGRALAVSTTCYTRLTVSLSGKHMTLAKGRPSSGHSSKDTAYFFIVIWLFLDSRLAPASNIFLRLLPTFAGALRPKNRTRVSLDKTPTNYIS